MTPLLDSLPGKVFAALAACLIVATGVGLVLLWPERSSEARLPSSLRPTTEQAEVLAVAMQACQNPAARRCRRVDVKLLSGPDRGTRAVFRTGEAGFDPEVDVGDRLRLVKNETPVGGEGGSIEPYSLTDFERRSTIQWLLLGFVALVVAFGRWRGALAVVGLGISLAVVIQFVLPAMLDGRAPLAVALVGSLTIMFVTIALAHGVGPKSLAAALGTATSLLLTAALALAFTELVHLTGFSSEEATLLQANAGAVSLEGLVLAGIVIGALGVLDDVTVSQASAVMALQRANPAQGFGQLYRGGLTVGRDHVAATVNTLVLAYVGASLPILLIFAVGETPFADAVNREAVAEQIVATLVGSIGLIAAVPVTTALAALLAARQPPPDKSRSSI
ncbi:MAG: YibE/F family protein [Thermoleophilaceae bacterium]|nr:YibE/F family protein [Thermoleophilaceae bacterium]